MTPSELTNEQLADIFDPGNGNQFHPLPFDNTSDNWSAIRKEAATRLRDNTPMPDILIEMHRKLNSVIFLWDTLEDHSRKACVLILLERLREIKRVPHE